MRRVVIHPSGRDVPVAILATLLLTLLPIPCRAQSRAEPRLVLSLFGGVAAGADLWEVNRQPLLVLGTELAPRYDTLRITRRVRPGLALGLSAMLYRSAHAGASAEMVFLGMSTEDVCTLVYENPDPLRRNAQICSDISQNSASPTTVGFFLGGIYRIAPRGFISPYVRLQAGVGARSGSVVEIIGAFIQGGVPRQRVVINDASGSRLSPSIGAAAGFAIPLAPGYQVHLELRDQLLLFHRVTGPADDRNSAIAPTERFAMHSVGLTAGLDIILEQKRGRRY
ncbi:MAG: hypothetical protein HY560_02065 [Gemmatimonadetes bacterium]|nr:hypothetical protein [Gemmatimonadota bacterium]